MLNRLRTLTAATLLSLSLAACITQREQVLAPDAGGVVIRAETGRPVQGARVRFVGRDALPPAITAADGRFTLQGQTERRVILAYPIGGVYRDTTGVMASVPGLADAYASADFVSAGRPASAMHDIPILMFPADAPDTPLHTLMADCVGEAEESHALHLATHVSTLDPGTPPDWLTPDRARALLEHLNRTHPFSRFQTCREASEAYALYSSATTVLEMVFAADGG
ncbi:hypothetical protein IP78_02770 [Brevundimonas sp. AAP58]|uniref:hypothetical protein n=1 Tax=Brevundimonas sp. AAP58 TaxID=1523422 RepID=UPI0006BA0B8B|nr:hypothetical protein [Brevundimonas sp. AAP58]KPF82979.1 hypothetical protein IP78_02770 [Brevundimonas sp. AAP58]